VLPDLLTNTVEAVKRASISSEVALPELLYSADMARSVNFNSSPIVPAAAIYPAMLWPIVRLVSGSNGVSHRESRQDAAAPDVAISHWRC
jgi:polar amino acid transport system permease protein